MLSGGLQTVSEVKADLARRAQATADAFEVMGDTTGRDAETVVRDKSGRRVDPKMERLRKRQEEQAKVEKEEQQMQWGRG